MSTVTADPIAVLIVDDQPMIRAGLRVILDDDPGISVVGEAGDGIEALASALELRPDVVLMDVRMPRSDGIAATRAIRDDSTLHDTRVIALTTFDEDEYLTGALQAGAVGFMLKDASAAELLNAIRRVHGGDAMLDPALTGRVIDDWVRSSLPASPRPDRDELADRLSPRERVVWRSVATGASNRAIAADLFLTEGTVKTHVHSLLTKLDCESRTQLVSLAYETGFVQPGSAP